MKRYRYIYVGMNDKNTKFYYNQETQQVYEWSEKENTKANPIYACSGIAGYAVYNIFKDVEVEPIALYIILGIVISVLAVVVTVVLAEKSNEKRFANASVYNSKNQKEWQKILAHGRKMIKTIWHIRIGALLFAVFCVGISNLIASFSWVFFNAIAWWLVGIMFVSTSVKKTKEVIALLEKRYT